MEGMIGRIIERSCMGNFASEQVARIEKMLADNIGVSQISVDGQTVQFNREQAIEELNYWRREAAKASGKRKTFQSNDIGSAM